MKARDILIMLDTYFEGNWETIYTAIVNKETAMLDDDEVVFKYTY